MFPLDDFLRCLHSLFYGSCFFFLRIFYFDLRCEHLLVCHPNSSQNDWCGWLQLPDSIQLAQNPFQLDFHPKQLVCKYPKPYFHVIRLFPWIMKVYKIYTYVYIYISSVYIYICIQIYIYISSVYIYIYRYICICIYIYPVFIYINTYIYIYIYIYIYPVFIYIYRYV